MADIKEKVERIKQETAPGQAGLGFSDLLDATDVQTIADLTVRLTEIRWRECNHPCIENFAPNLFHQLLTRRIMVKRGIMNDGRAVTGVMG